MKKQEIKVRINSNKEAEEVKQILLDAGEVIYKHNPEFSDIPDTAYFEFDPKREDWFIHDLDIGNEVEISIPQLREMLIQKQTVSIEVNEHDLPAIERVLNELAKARVKHPESSHYLGYDWHRMGSYLTEETLESIQAINDGRIHDAKIEVAQTAAVCLRILSGC